MTEFICVRALSSDMSLWTR